MPPAITLTPSEEAQLTQTVEMFEVITQSQPHDYQSLEILREAYFKLGRERELVDTSKRIAKAYVQMGQLSSAILEYESILQRCPDDEETRGALAEIECKATGLSGQEGLGEAASSVTRFIKQKADPRAPAQSEINDGRDALHKIFVEGKIVSAQDFEACWVQQDWSSPLREPVTPFIQILADRNVLALEKSLRVMTDKVRLGYLPIDKYDIDIELARSFPAETCLRWCVLPFDRMSKSVLVATANPFNRQVASELEGVSHHRLLFYLSPPTEIIYILKKVFR
jgi:tetratricopeptide (TPR) repeat protein